MSLHIFGIRHHGSGSARSLKQALESLQPDIILVEGAPEAEPILPLVIDAQMQPPVAILIYSPDELKKAVYYPFAVFSPEWQAIKYGLENQIPIRFIDLPQTHQLALNIEPEINNSNNIIFDDPLSLLAQAAGYSDSEHWWENLVEQRQDSRDIFAAILTAMTTLRQELNQENNNPDNQEEKPNKEALREAYMRQKIREAKKENYDKIAVVCGAWHAPVLQEYLPNAKADQALLKGLAKIKVEATWIPWTYNRLTKNSGYGAGINSPGWYEHLWQFPFISDLKQGENARIIAINWIIKVARLLREEDLDASSASVIEAVRLAETLAALRNISLPGLAELNEAVLTVFCFGDPTPMQLIENKLIISDRLGEVPSSTPIMPLQQDLEKLQKRLRLKPEISEKRIELDLRKENDLEKSYLLHRLNILGINWAEIQQTRGKGTFKEGWRLQWNPEFVVKLIEVGVWGNTVYDAATSFSQNLATNTHDLPTLTKLIDQVLLAALPDAITFLMSKLQAEAAIASDITHLMTALPPLVKVLRYSDVRQTDTATISHVVNGLIARICIGLPVACASMNDEAAEAMSEHIMTLNSAIKLLENETYLQNWYQILKQMTNQVNLHGLLSGYCCRLLLDSRMLSGEEAVKKMSLALGVANDPHQAATWIEGFLKGSGLLLLHEQQIWQILDDWVINLSSENFLNLLPLLRRTFANFSDSERRQMGENIRGKNTKETTYLISSNIDQERANLILPVLAQILGL